jgi:o-succinylbenzoate---CoA ligase
MPPAHVGGLSIVLRCLHARRTVVLPSAEAKAGHFDPIAICSTIARDRVTIVSFVPTMLHRVFSAEPNWHGHVGLRAVLLGGAATSSKLLQAARERNVPVLTTYGLTEACSQVTTQKYGTPPSEEHGAGPPLLGTEVRIVDDQILVRGPSMMSSYFPPDAHPNPFLSDGWFPTGDSGRLDGKGCLHVAGRRRDLIVTGGENVYPAEVERQLEGWMGVRAAGVFGIADETWGQVVCAALVWDLSMPFVAPDVAKRLDSEFAPHKRPRFIALLPDLPLTQSGKIDRGRLAELAGPRLAAI